jgi:hypothetical protein
MVTADANTGASYGGFWVQDKKSQNLVTASPSTEKLMYTLCRTLRNGFDHFNFRYLNVTPREYFNKLALPLPGTIIDPDLAANYRIFICDWKSDRAEFMEPTSDTRVIGTQFARLRYSLFRFLADFFSEPGRTPYRDILTLLPLT